MGKKVIHAYHPSVLFVCVDIEVRFMVILSKPCKKSFTYLFLGLGKRI